MTNTYIKVRTQFQGFHCYPNAGKIDSRIKFLEERHRHIFYVTVKISVQHDDRELEFFLTKWSIENFIKESEFDYQSCEMIAESILEFLREKYGERYYEITVSEDNESDGIIEYIPNKD